MKPNALTSLWGQGHAAALEKETERLRQQTVLMAQPGQRRQDICTPQEIVSILVALWTDGIAMDPCSCPESIVPADIKLTEHDYEGKGGLGAQWSERTYCNPPYGDLKKWLLHGRDFWEVVWLIPLRPHRKWWRQWARRMDTIIYLNPLKFVGFEQAFPGPLVLGYKGEQVSKFIGLCAHVGEPI